MAEIKVGDTLYRFDRNRRVYGKDKRIIYEEYFTAHVITGETKQSWLVDFYRDPAKVNKKTLQQSAGAFTPYQWFTAEEMAADIWRHENRTRIVKAVEDADTATLRAIDELLISRFLP